MVGSYNRMHGSLASRVYSQTSTQTHRTMLRFARCEHSVEHALNNSAVGGCMSERACLADHMLITSRTATACTETKSEVIKAP